MKELKTPAEGTATEENQEGLTPGTREAAMESATETATEPALEESPESAQPSTPVEIIFAPDAPDLGLEAVPMADVPLRAVLEALIYVAEEPITLAQIAGALGEPAERIGAVLAEIMAEFDKPEHGLSIREVAGGFTLPCFSLHSAPAAGPHTSFRLRGSAPRRPANGPRRIPLPVDQFSFAVFRPIKVVLPIHARDGQQLPIARPWKALFCRI